MKKKQNFVESCAQVLPRTYDDAWSENKIFAVTPLYDDGYETFTRYTYRYINTIITKVIILGVVLGMTDAV